MSELAFNLNGDPFDVPGNAIGWRVRKLKPKGAPEVVYGRDGTPLVLPIDADMDDLRREARSEGRYRLDALDEQSRVVGNVPAGYVCIHPSEPAEEPRPTPPVAPGVDHAVIEAMRVNAELARAVIDRFPMMLESAAVLLRAADNAGMPARPPRMLVPDDDEGEDAGEAPEPTPPAKTGGVMGFVEMLLEKLAPEVMKAVLSGKLQVPGGVGALLDCRRAVPKADAAEVAPASTPGVGPAPGRRDPAPAASPRASAGSRRANAKPAAAPATPADLPTIDQADMAHFAAILNALTLRERMYAQALAGELSPAELRAWTAELKQLSVAEAVAKLRDVLGPEASGASDATDAPTTAGPAGIPGQTSGGAS